MSLSRVVEVVDSLISLNSYGFWRFIVNKFEHPILFKLSYLFCVLTYPALVSTGILNFFINYSFWWVFIVLTLLYTSFI